MKKYSTLILLVSGTMGIFIIRAALSEFYELPHTFDIFGTLTILGSLFVMIINHTHIKKTDWIAALSMGLFVGVGMCFSTLFTPYPFLGVVKTIPGQAILRGTFTAIAALGGLTIMRMYGPITFHLANQDRKQAGTGSILGLSIGLPLAVINIIALQSTQGRAIQWQHPLSAIADAFQPALVEEFIYRFALWGLLWLVLRHSLLDNANWISGLLAMLVHNFSHFDDLFSQSPLVAVGMGLAMALLWGLPPLILARRKGLEAAISFHWIQDAARFIAGY